MIITIIQNHSNNLQIMFLMAGLSNDMNIFTFKCARLQVEEDAQATHHAVQQPAQHHSNTRPILSGSHGQQRSRERENTRDRERPRDRSKDKENNVCMNFH